MLMLNAKYAIGPVSKNIIDVCIDFSNKHNINLIFIPSRRQIDFCSNYVGFNTKDFSDYVRNRTKNILLERDHGGPLQGECKDDGLESLKTDCQFFDLIHIDVWKKAKNFIDGCKLTVKYIKYCFNINNNIYYEIGTEEAIFPYTSSQLNQLIQYCKEKLTIEEFSKIKYAVIQAGTSLLENRNIGNFNVEKLTRMVQICSSHGLLSKEHNGDYLSLDLINKKFNSGLDCINIAPELGMLETQVYLDNIKHEDIYFTFFNLCFESGKWKKWVNKDFDPFVQQISLIKICGHYVFTNPIFVKKVKEKLNKNIDFQIKSCIMKRLEELHAKR